MKNKWFRFVIALLFLVCIYIGVSLFADRRYNLISVILSVLSILCFYFKYETQVVKGREIVIVAVMVALITVGRFMFIITPSFKPTLALIILFGMSFGRISGFVCGSLSAFISNFLFGQGPWTPFQMLSCGLIGYFAGILNYHNRLTTSLFFRTIYGIVSAVGYSLLMDIWTVLAMDGTFNMYRYIVAVMSSLPVMGIYIIANIFFLYLLTPILVKKMERIRLKYGLTEEK